MSVVEVTGPIDLDRFRNGMTYLHVTGLPSNQGRLNLLTEAIARIQADPTGAMRVEYLGIKNYAGFGDQREDHGYGMVPRHGTIVFEIGRNSAGRKDGVALGPDEIYMLECVRDAGVVSWQDLRVRDAVKVEGNLCGLVAYGDMVCASLQSALATVSGIAVTTHEVRSDEETAK